MNFVFLFLGLAGLWFGASLVIRSAQNVARHFRILEFLVGLTLISIGTSLPEISISIAGAINRLGGNEISSLVIGDKMGSIISQMTLVLGIAGLSGLLKIGKRQWLRDGGFLLGGVVLFLLMSLDGRISQVEGIILVLIYITYFIYLLKSEKNKKEKIIDLDEKQLHLIKPKLNIIWDIVLLVSGVGLIIYSSRTVVNFGTLLAESWGVSQTIVGTLLIGSLGSSLPEMMVSIQAIRKKSASLSVGNLLGGNICNILFSVGIGSSISGFLVDKSFLMIEIPLIIFATVLALYFFRTRQKLSRWEATVMIFIFVAYASFKILTLI